MFHSRGVAAVVASGVLLLAGCSSDTEQAAVPSSSPDSAAPSSSSAAAVLSISPVDLSERIDHVHGLVATKRDTVVAGTHSGARQITRTGEVTAPGDQTDDLMGMTGEAGTSRLASSGHPGVGSSFPNPVGLIVSEDGGANWSAVSLQGQIDFHALTINGSDMIGYGGGPGLLVSKDAGQSWQEGAGLQPAALATSGDRVLATTQAGLQVSENGGRSFAVVKDAPRLALISAGSDETVLGLDPAGAVWSSIDSGRTWTEVGRAEGAQAVGAFADGTGYAISETKLFVIS